MMIHVLLFQTKTVSLLKWKEFLRLKHMLIKIEILLKLIKRRFLKLIQAILQLKNYLREWRKNLILKLKKLPRFYMKEHLLTQVTLWKTLQVLLKDSTHFLMDHLEFQRTHPLKNTKLILMTMKKKVFFKIFTKYLLISIYD